MQKILDAYGRHRSKMVAVRATGAELKRMWNCASDAGKGKQPYIYWALNHPVLKGVGNARLIGRLEGSLKEVELVLVRLAEKDRDPLLLQTIEILQEALEHTGTEQEGSDGARIS